MTTQRKQVGAGWLKTSNDGRKKFISIVINGGLAPDINLVMFTNSYKEKENQPDYIIYLTQPREASPSVKPVNQNEFPAPDSPDSGGAECHRKMIFPFKKEEMMFKKAQRTQTKLKIAITGPSGSGKTFSALLIAAGIGKRIAVIDTENKSASLYAGMEKGPLAGLEFDILEIEPPYTIAKYLEGIEAAEKARYDVLLIDSISHAWAGEGGLLDKKTALDARGGNSYTNWAMITPEQERFKARILQADTHIICTMRSKQDYVLELNARGKSVPKKVGLAPIQRDGMEYEFTTVLDMAMDHHAVASKDRTCLFDGQVFKPTKDTGVKIMKWLKAARPIQKPVDPGQDTEQDSTPAASAGQDDHNDTAITEEQLNKITGSIMRIKARGYSMLTINKGITDTVKKVCNRDFMTRGFLNVAAVLTELTEVEADVVISYLSAWETHLNNNKKRPVAKEA